MVVTVTVVDVAVVEVSVVTVVVVVVVEVSVVLVFVTVVDVSVAVVAVVQPPQSARQVNFGLKPIMYFKSESSQSDSTNSQQASGSFTQPGMHKST